MLAILYFYWLALIVFSTAGLFIILRKKHELKWAGESIGEIYVYVAVLIGVSLGTFLSFGISVILRNIAPLIIFPAAIVITGVVSYFWLWKTVIKCSREDNEDRELNIWRCLEALKADPANGAIHEKLAELYREKGEIGKALEHLNAAIKYDSRASLRWKLEEMEKEAGESTRRP